MTGDLADEDRRRGMGVVVEYAGRSGKPVWSAPKPFRWDSTRFGRQNTKAPEPDATIDMVFAKDNAADHGFNRWTINGRAFSTEAPQILATLHQGRRYRLHMQNAGDDIHPGHLHRPIFELVEIAGRPTARVMKGVAMLGGCQRMAIDFVADDPGRTLFHCHQQLHMDYGFMALFDYA
ncbi:MAG TPA: multicopper oxidase domain-containing protein [Stellaceae bacterium]|nr:multicopper oxidase domain-containing protein [Stellaceae bacterium]